MLRRTVLWTLAIGSLAAFSLVQAQEARPRREGAGPPQEGRRFDLGQMRERMMSNLKEQLVVSEDEWKAMQPKVEKIMTLQRDTRAGFGGFGRMRDEQPQSKVAEAQRDLRKAVDDKASAEDIAKKLTAYREARDKARDELKEVQKELKGQVKPQQEAVLVLNGFLD